MKVRADELQAGDILRDGRVVAEHVVVNIVSGTARVKLEGLRNGVRVRRWSTFDRTTKLEVKRDA